MSRPKSYKVLTVNQPSDNVVETVRLEEHLLPALQKGQVLIKMLAAPINPSDVYTIKGRYASVKEYPRAMGFEGVAEIIETGNDVTLKVGDHVIMTSRAGSWRDYAVFDEDQVQKVDSRIPVRSAATMMVNPTTAYYLITEAGLEAGQALIQNGANSMVGKAVIQIAKSMGIKTINVVRDRANLAELVAELKELGADHVVTVEDLKAGKLDVKAQLAIDCVSGESASLLMRHLDNGGTLVNYGGLSGQPLTAPIRDLIFRAINVRGCHLQRSLSTDKDTAKTFAVLGNMMADGTLKPPKFESFRLEDYEKALTRATTEFTNTKQLFVMDDALLSD